ncbi:tyrosine recombinase [Oceanispirochaeta crateris]|uniref:Tyrosine recombinase XerC n=1 Tax=Oceanispirochaeta crateris TaxID=2518645 RepID=A0A5C1QKQ0_9SPIO|nr:tyrosine-type recombinase/integrase [Oceanispirochaeta crateris]QEN07898.1 tyrosine recombinase [Oceanispirochaeta crateris]
MISEFDVHLKDYEHHLRALRGLSERTLRAYSNDISAWHEFLNEQGLNEIEAGRDDARMYISTLSVRQLATSTINRSLSSLKSYYSYLEKRNIVDGNPFLGVRSIKKPATLPVYLTNREVSILLDHVEGDDFTAQRDRSLFEMLYSTGCRVSELCHLTVQSVSTNRILIKGKGGKERYVFIGEKARHALELYLPLRSQRLIQCGLADIQSLILDERGQGLSTRGVYYLLQKYMRKSGLNRKIGPHAFRHAFATEILNEGADIRVVQELLGHASLSTTQVYTHTGIERIRQVYRNAHPHGKQAIHRTQRS